MNEPLRATDRLRLALLIGLVVLGFGLYLWPYTVDDAFVLGRYAARLASGRGLTFIDGPATDGVTAPPALLPGTIATWMGWDAVDAAKALGLGAAVIAAGLTVHRAGAFGGRGALATAAVLATSFVFVVSSVAGLETGLATLWTTALVLVHLDRRERPILIGALVGALPWWRPELFVFGSILLLGRSRRAWAMAVGGLLVIIAYRLALFGHPLPLAARAKPASIAYGIDYAARGVVIAFGAFGAIATLEVTKRGWAAVTSNASDPDAAATRRLGLLGAALVAHVVAIMVAGGDWMPGARLFAPVIPAFALLVGASVAIPSTAREPWARGRAWAMRLAAISTLAVLAAVGFVSAPDARSAGLAHDARGRELARWLETHGERVAALDVGRITYGTDLDVVDLGGITDPSVADLPGGHADKAIDIGWLDTRAPDLVVLGSRGLHPRVDEHGQLHLRGLGVERRLASSPWLHAHFRPARVTDAVGDHRYLVLVRRERPTP